MVLVCVFNTTYVSLSLFLHLAVHSFLFRLASEHIHASMLVLHFNLVPVLCAVHTSLAR